MLLESRSKINTQCKIQKPSRRGRTFTQKQTDHTSYEEKAKLRASEKNSIEKASMLRKSDDKAGNVRVQESQVSTPVAHTESKHLDGLETGCIPNMEKSSNLYLPFCKGKVFVL
ncbi:hypothetical protein D5086_013489 [Populus alba]|uniref:Uncharacterized protein n=1 Tax=Populus alba TaxID=43335 RepID=A0ACC4C6Z6_POPAL